MKTSGNTVLITGGATGIGLALVDYLLKEGNEVIICGRRAERLKEAQQKFPAIHTRVADVASELGREELINWVISKFPSFNVLINNAGIQQLLFLKKPNSTAAIYNEVATNLIAPIHLTNLAIPYLSRQKEAAIVNVTSGLAFVPLVIAPVYCATKAALHSFCLSSRHQLRDTSVKVFEIIPPIVETELGHDNSRKERDVRGIQPSEVAVETMKALENDQFEVPIGIAAGIYNAAHSGKVNEVLQRMNG
jgi:Short-chain dehydrogenase involved in D-alanine esterification of lipoteichoic acid and wall teichoic acid (D-alanine transfer protein)